MTARTSRKRPTLADVARATGVSVATVSRAFAQPEQVQPETVSRIKAMAARLGYESAHGGQSVPRPAEAPMVGAIVPTLDYSIFARAIHALQVTLAEHGTLLLVAAHEYSSSAEMRCLDLMLRKDLGGLLVVGADRPDDTWARLQNAGIPTLIAWSFDERLPSIGFDNFRAGFLAAEHLLSLGHTNFGMVSGVLRGNDRAQLRLKGVRAALAAAGLQLSDWQVSEQPFSLAGGRTGLDALLSVANPPTAIIGGNDLLAVGSVIEAHQLGLRVPEDLSIVGMDNLEMAAHFLPPLTTVHLPTQQLGEKAAHWFIAQMKGQPVERRMELPIELVIRKSTAPVRDGVTAPRPRVQGSKP